MEIKQQTKNKVWFDEQGLSVPRDRIKPLELLKEKHAYKIATQALKINKSLAEFKEQIREMSYMIYNLVLSESERERAKGNFTWYNFDETIKVEVSVNGNIAFDDLLIEKAKLKLVAMLGESISESHKLVKDLVTEAFQTSRGKLDTRKIMSLKKYKDRIKDERYHEAMDLIDQSIRRPDSTTYFRVSVRNDQGKYEFIDLNFSSI